MNRNSKVRSLVQRLLNFKCKYLFLDNLKVIKNIMRLLYLFIF